LSVTSHYSKWSGANDYYDAAEATATNGNGLSLINPLKEMQQQYRKRSNNVLDLNAYVTFNVVKNLTIRSVAAIDYNNTNSPHLMIRLLTIRAPLAANSRLLLVANNNYRTINNSNTLDYNNTSLFGFQAQY
jgi:hypothetical protein